MLAEGLLRVADVGLVRAGDHCQGEDHEMAAHAAKSHPVAIDLSTVRNRATPAGRLA